MPKSLIEFKRFLMASGSMLSEREKKLVNLILDDFFEVAGSGSSGGVRGKVLAKLIVAKGDTVSADLEVESEAAKDGENRIVRLSKITVEHFRGFSDAQIFEFKNPYTFVYWPNGTGKSSLCESLEYGLLGSIHEADSKRIPIDDYIKNAISNKSKKPLLLGDTATVKDVEIKADPGSYEFCFIEKNRIDGFARVSANTPAAQQARLAALFGLEEFNTFATQFNEGIDSYLDCVGKKAKELTDREKGIAGHKAVLEDLPNKVKDAEARSLLILAQYPEAKTLAEIKASLAGSEGNGGKQKINHTEIARLQSLKSVVYAGFDGVTTDANDLLALIKEKEEAESFLAQYKEQLSLGGLYSAILGNRSKFDNVCPACSSELYKDWRLAVPVDPYEYADGKLKEFDVAIKKEGRIKEIWETLNTGWSELRAKITKLSTLTVTIWFTRANEIESFYEKATVVDSKDITGLKHFLNSVSTRSELFQALKDSATAFNEMVESSKAKIKTLEAENSSIAKVLEEIIAITTLVAANAKAETDAKEAIEKFNRENEALIKEVETERPVIARNVDYCTAYVSFRKKLLEYNAALPVSLVSDLNEKTLRFYNAINKYDQPSDKLKSLNLPSSVGGKIEIEYESGEKCDALQVLSEGHIRCLGLAILLAKIMRDDLPFLIFDDVVNSIDDEHRSAITELILNPDEVGKRQLIVTTHGEDFVKRLENAVPKSEYNETVTRIDFLAPVEKKITVRLDLPRHYLIVASQRYNDGMVRDSLTFVRKSFEELLNRLWKKIANKKLSVQISVWMRAPGLPDLMSVATGLYKFLDKEGTVFQEAVPCLAELLWLDVTHPIEWNYLNKGVHEEGRTEEFDAVVVKRMLDVVIKLDEAIE